MTIDKRTKEYHTSMMDHALAMIDRGDSQPSAIIHSLIETFACHKSTAHRVARKALDVRAGRRDPNHWGGRREGSGRPVKTNDESS